MALPEMNPPRNPWEVDPYPSYEHDMKKLETLMKMSAVPWEANPKGMTEYTALVIPGGLEVRISKTTDLAEVLLGGAKLSITRKVLKQLVDKLYEEFNMEGLSK